MLVTPGRYNAKVLSHSISETKAGDPQAVVRFQFETDEGQTFEMNWYGSFKPKAAEHTLKALVVCGLKGSNPADDLEIGKEVSIVVATDQDLNGNDRSVVRWVNKVGGAVKSMESSEAKNKLEKFAGAIMALKQSEGFDENDELPEFLK